MKVQKLKKADRLNLLICGAMRSGTTSLKHYLSEHPEVGFIEGGDIVIPDEISGYYPFASPSLSQSQLGDNPAVYQQFSQAFAGKKAYIADKRAYFMFFPQIPFNLKEQLPDVKLIFILRNPVEIVYSAFSHEKYENNYKMDFETYIENSLVTLRQASNSFNRHNWIEMLRPGHALPPLIERGLYYHQIKRFYRLFNEEQILVLRFDLLKTDAKSVMNEILRFLGLSQNFEFKTLSKIYNFSQQSPMLSENITLRLMEIFEASNTKLLSFLGWPSSLWDHPYSK